MLIYLSPLPAMLLLAFLAFRAWDDARHDARTDDTGGLSTIRECERIERAGREI